MAASVQNILDTTLAVDTLGLMSDHALLIHIVRVLTFLLYFVTPLAKLNLIPSHVPLFQVIQVYQIHLESPDSPLIHSFQVLQLHL
jgi:hypothetical protein